jgi:Flp pilus assembly protein TadD
MPAHKPIHTGIALVAIYLFAHAAATVSPSHLWGIDALAYLPGERLLLIVIGLTAAAALLYRFSTTRNLDPWRTASSTNGFAFGLAVIFGGLSVAAYSRIDLLGDGFLYIREIEQATDIGDLARMDRAPLTFVLIRALATFLRPLGISALLLYKGISCLSGISYVLLAVWFCRIVTNHVRKRAIVLVALLTVPSIQLFFGYAENYSLLHLGVMAYVLLAFRAMRGSVSPYAASLCLGVLIPIHLSAVLLVPSLILVISKTLRTRSTALLLMSAITVAILWLMDFDIAALIAHSGSGANTLNLTGTDAMRPYGLLSAAHILDWLNLYLLIAPAALLVLPVCGCRLPNTDDLRFLLTLSVPAIAFTFVVNPEIGAFRDWDVLSLPAIPLAIWAGLAFANRHTDTPGFGRSAIFTWGTVALHTVAWITLNATPDAALHRYRDHLTNGTLATHARSYGWETLALHHRNRDEIDLSISAFDRGLQATPHKARLWNALGMMSVENDRFDAARRALLKSAELEPYHGTWFNIGLICTKLGRTDETIHAYQNAIRLHPGHVKALNNLASAYGRIGQYEDAAVTYQTALQHVPTEPTILNNLGTVYVRLQDYAQAEQSYLAAIHHGPRVKAPYENLSILYASLGDKEKARSVQARAHALPN